MVAVMANTVTRVRRRFGVIDAAIGLIARRSILPT
jgi:hypothetical protein